jgi:hypothetical protein
LLKIIINPVKRFLNGALFYFVISINNYVLLYIEML